MIRSIIDIPLAYSRAVDFNWRPDWRGSPSAQGLNGSEQVVMNRLPRFVGSPQLALPPDFIGLWRAKVLQAEGRVNAYRMRMYDPAVYPVSGGGSWRGDLLAIQAGLYQEPRPQVRCVAAVAAGATSIVVDETDAPRPVAVGAYLSHGDWPFVVTDRSGSGEEATLSVKMLRRPIPADGQIDLIARGVFVATSDAMGFPDYGLDRVSRPSLEMAEWITR